MLYSCPNDKGSDLLVKTTHSLSQSSAGQKFSAGLWAKTEVPAELHSCLRTPGQNAGPCLPASPPTLGWARFLHPQKSATLTLSLPFLLGHISL